MQLLPWAAAFVLAASPVLAAAQTAPPNTPALTLAEALRLAESASPAVRAREAQLEAAEGARREAASALFNNPSLSAEGIRAHAEQPQGSWNEWSVGIAQPFETGGQQARRREAAASALDALRAEIEDMRRQARADAALRFNEVLAAQRRVQLEQHSVELFDGTAQAVAKRRAAGEDTRLDANVALIEAERSRDALALAGEKLSDARSALATAVQLPPSALPEVADEATADVAAPPSYTLEQLLAAMQAMPRNRALASREDAARARLELSRASRNPDVTLGLNVGREGPGDARNNLAMLSISLPLPLFNRNEAAIGQALTEVSQSQIERTSVLRDAEARVRQLWSRLNSQRQRLQRLQRVLTQAAADNQQLSARSRQAGQIGLLEQLLVNRQALDAERELNELRAEQRATRIEIEYAAGWPQEGTAR